MRLPTQVARGVSVGHSHGPRLHALVLQTPEVLLDAVELLDDLPVVVEQRDGRLLVLARLLAGQPHGGQRHVLPADAQPAHGAARPVRPAHGVDELAQALVAQHVAAGEGVRGLVVLQAPLVLCLLPGVGVDVVELHGGAGGAGGAVQGATMGVLEGGATQDGADVARAGVARAGVARAVAGAEAVRSLARAAGVAAAVAAAAAADAGGAWVAPVTVVVAVAVAVVAAQAGSARVAVRRHG